MKAIHYLCDMQFSNANYIQLRALIVLCCRIVRIYPCMHAFTQCVSAVKFERVCLSIETKVSCGARGRTQATKQLSVATRWSSVCMYVCMEKGCFHRMPRLGTSLSKISLTGDLGGKGFGHYIIMFRRNVKKYHDLQHMQQICGNKLQDPIIWHLVQNIFLIQKQTTSCLEKMG